MWELTAEQRTNEEGVTYTAYGLRCGECVIPDFSSLREETEAFISLMNRLEVSPIHAADVVEDYFAAL